MKSIRYIFKIGYGPSSSHTMGPAYASDEFIRRYPDADRYRVMLYGSLAKTGRGHGTDAVIRKCFREREVEILFDTTTTGLPHPNTMLLTALKQDRPYATCRAMSIGGGSVVFEGEGEAREEDNRSLPTFRAISDYCRANDLTLWDYVKETEGGDIEGYLSSAWEAMQAALHRGLNDTGTLPGGLGVAKKARYLYLQAPEREDHANRENRIVCAYAFAVSEQNASGEQIVTAPTCGACGVLPSVLYYYREKNGLSDADIIRALGVAGLIGNLVKHNASISGAECGCQAEIGTACAMAAAAIGELQGLSMEQIEYAAEIAIEHHLGLTCDPIRGLVQIPCIERNAVAAMRAINAVSLATFLADTRKISLDDVIHTMKETGLHISHQYRETSEGGLAKLDIR